MARLGLPAWAVDLAAAGLASRSINDLGAALLAFGRMLADALCKKAGLEVGSKDGSPIIRGIKLLS